MTFFSTDPTPSMDDIPALLETMAMMTTEKEEKSGGLSGWMRFRRKDIGRPAAAAPAAAAAKQIYILCDVKHKQNRVPMVCSGNYDVLTPLAHCLTRDGGDVRNLACLALNNLSIPAENKRVMAQGPSSGAVLGALCKVIAEGEGQSYLCCICLMNLSFLEENITAILRHSPAPCKSYPIPIPPLENSDSLIRILEDLLKKVPAVLKPGLQKSEAVRWACGLIKNLAKSEENADLLGRTDIPKCVVGNILRKSDNPPTRWLVNSPEDFSLFIVLNLAQWPTSRQALIEAGALDTIKPAMAAGGLQGLKAAMACALLGATWSDFPDGGSSAAKSISELMSNIVEKKGKEGQYAYGVFKLYTASKAYRDLCRAANSTIGYYDGANAMVLDVSSADALFRQVESDISSAADGEFDGGSQSAGVKSIEYSAVTVAYIKEAAATVSEEIDPHGGGRRFDSNTVFDELENERTPLIETKIV